MQFVLFTDNLSDLDVPELCQAVKKAGFDGVDLTLRPGGHVKPADVEVGMAEARRYADAAGLTIPMVTTAITDVSSPQAEAVFAAAAHYGARHLKLGYWEYRPFGTVAKQLDDAQHKLERLVRLGRKYNVLPCIHCHSGAVLPNNGAFLYLLLRDFKPTEAGAYVDTMHMAIEGGLSGWEMGLDLALDHAGWSKELPLDRGRARRSWPATVQSYVHTACGRPVAPAGVCGAPETVAIRRHLFTAFGIQGERELP